MEIKSEPKFDLVTITDIDIAFPGDLQTFALREGVDSYEEDADTLVITFGAGGTLALSKVHAHWLAVRKRTMRVAAAPEQKPVQP